MTIQTVLTVLLVVLVAALASLLIIRIRIEKRQTAAIRRMSQADFAEFLRANSLEGTIQTVAGKVSDLLQTAFGCKRVIFLRKQRGLLELNYYHGIHGFNRRDFRLRFSRELAGRLQEEFLPRPIAALEKDLPETFCQKLRHHGFDLFFPIFWRENLYGVYFIKSSIETSATAFNVLVAAVAQSLSAAYHIKWHESKFDRMQQRPGKAAAFGGHADRRSISARLLQLVRHRDSETIVREVFDTVRAVLNLPKAALVYEGRQRGEPLRLLRSDSVPPLDLPDQSTFERLLMKLSDRGRTDVIRLDADSEMPAEGTGPFRNAGLEYLAVFPLSKNRGGLFAWCDSRAPAEIVNHLRMFRGPVSELVGNAESFERAEEMSYTDNLTGLANRRYFARRIKEEIDRAKRYHRSLALMILDMDDLKKINDRFGHQAGDAVIKRMGQILRSSIRAIDIIARYGGDEFCVLMPEADAATCERFMNRLQLKIASSKFSAANARADLECTISSGGAVFPEHATSPDALIFSADMALLKAKEAGRNNSRLYSPVN